MVRALAKVLTNEQAHLRKYYWLGKALGFLGGLACGVALFAALRRGDSVASWLVVMSGVGGVFAGLAVYFNSSVRQWPVLRQFINEQAIQEAARDEKLYLAIAADPSKLRFVGRLNSTLGCDRLRATTGGLVSAVECGPCA
jgi:hypothetical protein